MSRRLIVICGPTGVGKTQLALHLAKLVPGALVACDSRQVYTGMDIGTGKDIPPQAKTKLVRLKAHRYPVYQFQAVSHWGYDLINPATSFSVMNYVSLIQPVFNHLWRLGQVPLLTAGTGLYLTSLFHPPATGPVPPNLVLRSQLASLSLIPLQRRLKQLNPAKWVAMNQADRLNPRRLIRAIEVSTVDPQAYQLNLPSPIKSQVLWLGLTAPTTWLDRCINRRVQARATFQFTDEVKVLVQRYPDFLKLPAATATGYREWLAYLDHRLTRQQAVAAWQLRERQYARRQLTWFKTLEPVLWFDVSQSEWQRSVVDRVITWYS
ncbi:tRNA (adenosine(37)-N6)-dimethylallyltransferase MiaA [Microgenomates group bacterium RBG_16_45_19]|nr:MAG: tRNA (adenosine(37)-N6)-dimethylallyltransferase MiaA [Microgenomates group bacterium RBG_16_45_19]